MASSACTGALRRAAAVCSKKLNPCGVRSLHSSSPKPAAAHGADDPNAYLHAYHMYDIPAMKNRSLKFGLGVGSVVIVGVAVPIVAVIHQQIKAKG